MSYNKLRQIYVFAAGHSSVGLFILKQKHDKADYIPNCHKYHLTFYQDPRHSKLFEEYFEKLQRLYAILLQQDQEKQNNAAKEMAEQAINIHPMHLYTMSITLNY